ncbi:MAG TPA: C25 family cysteine peptidase, partial [Chitinophagaceae bacterium]|nr:C25 family cysteine peptidase [Chitinophagaceae bacterium]
LHRISQPILAGLGIGNVPAEQFKLWRNGREVPVYTTVQTGPMAASDYIEFWGEMNDGRPDSVLYRIRDFQLNDKWSLETDTVAYFLTVNPAGGNLRLVPAANVLPSAIPPEPFYISTVGKYFKDKLNSGYAAVVGEYVYSSVYDQGEGWTSFDLGTGLTTSPSFPYLSTYTGPGAPAPVLKVNASGNALNPRNFTVKINSNQVANQTMDFFDYVKTTIPVSVSDISSGSAVIDIKNNCTASNDRMVIAKVELTYARTFNFQLGDNTNNISFELPASAVGNYIEITGPGFNYGSLNPVLYDITNGKRYQCDITNPAIIKVLLAPSATARKILLTSQDPSLVKSVTSIQSRNFVNYSNAANQGNYLIISHPVLNAGPGGTNPVDDYRSYRSSAAGGSHISKVYMIDDLMDQFGFGIKKNPLGIRNFLRWARNNFSTAVKNVLLIGKGLNYQSYRANESNPNVEELSFIPTYGSPASDMLLAADPGPDEIPKVSIGRISAISGNEVADYLAKVVQYEQQQAFQSPLIIDKAWMKNVVHTVGASDSTLGAILQSDMNNYGRIIKDTFYGGNVSAFSKVSAAPIEQSSSERLNSLFREGIGMLTYFGHSSASTLEFNLDNPDQYYNPSKYPVFVVLGCNAGNFYNFNTIRFLTKETLSEKFVLAPQRGSIAYIASTHLGIVHYLDIYNTRFYTALSTTHYGKTLGEIMKETVIQVYNLTTQNDFYARFHCEQQTLHGDPALRLDISMAKPDYVVEDQLIKVSPQFISVAETQFKVDAKFLNMGKAINKNIVV